MSECINWTGSKDAKGYGLRRVKGKLWRVHRLSYTEAHGEIPKGLVVMHSCDNPSCYNVEHLSLGTHQDNCDDKHRKGRFISGQAKKTDGLHDYIRSSSNSTRALAKELGLHHSTIGRIRNHD